MRPYALSDHFDGQHFFNPQDGGRGWRPNLLRILRWRLAERRDPAARAAWPAHVSDPPFAPPAAPPPGHAAITFLGHASFLIQLGGAAILCDPIFSPRCSPLASIGPKRVRAPGLALGQLPPIDLVLVSHNHYDHCDLPSLRAIAQAHHPRAVTLLGNAALIGRAGLAADELDWWQSLEIATVRITALPARHFSRRGAFDLNRALWGGFMIEADGLRVLFAGDSAAGAHYAQIAARCGAPDVALLPIGAYAPRAIMAAVHMNPEEAVDAHLALGAHHSIGMHWGTFRLTAEAMLAPVEGLHAACTARGVTNFDVMGVGQTRYFGPAARPDLG